MLDAVVVGQEPVVHAPQHGLGAAVDVDLAVERADVGLDGVGAQVGQGGDLGVALALGDQRQDLRLAVGEALSPAGPLQAAPVRDLVGDSLTTTSPAWTASSAPTSSRAVRALER